MNVAIKPELLEELLKSCKTPDELFGPEGLMQRLKGALMERMLDAEMTEHLGYEAYEGKGRGAGNSRNGYTTKTVETESGKVDIRVPRDRAGTFEPQVVPKHRRRLEGFDDKVRELYGTDVSPDLISRVTDAVIDEAKMWQSRPLEALYPIIYLDALFVSIRDGATVQKKAVYVALGVTMDGKRNVLGIWFEQTEGAKFWLSVLTDLRNRGVEDVFFVCCDGLSGFPQAIE